jgi:hypothetical protein
MPPASAQRAPGSTNTPITGDPQNSLSFQILCSSSTQTDFRGPIACISPDFVSRRRKSHPGPVRARKKRYCTVFLQFPGFWVHRNFQIFSNRPIIAPLGKRSPRYRTPSFPPLYSPEGDFLQRRPSVDRRIGGTWRVAEERDSHHRSR